MIVDLHGSILWFNYDDNGGISWMSWQARHFRAPYIFFSVVSHGTPKVVNFKSRKKQKKLPLQWCWKVVKLDLRYYSERLSCCCPFFFPFAMPLLGVYYWERTNPSIGFVLCVIWICPQIIIRSKALFALATVRLIHVFIIVNEPNCGKSNRPSRASIPRNTSMRIALAPGFLLLRRVPLLHVRNAVTTAWSRANIYNCRQQGPPLCQGRWCVFAAS